MRKYLALIFAAVAGVAVADTQEPAVASSINSTVESIAPAYHNMPKDMGNIPTTFPHQPPLVPHSVRGLQVTKNTNQCLGCHAIEPSKTTGAPRLPESHFMDRDGKRVASESPRRYFCLQCHVQQADISPIIQNKFETIRQNQAK